MIQDMKLCLFAFLAAITLFLVPFESLASDGDLSPAVSVLSKDFSEKFCDFISNGVTTQKAVDNSAAQLSKDLLFSPVMNQIIATSKEELTASLSTNIFDRCGNDLGGKKEDLDNYLAQLARRIPSKSSNSIQLPLAHQKTFE